MKKYSTKIESSMKTFHSSLNEKEKRLYSASESLKLGFGGITYISKILNCARDTIYAGLKDLNEIHTLKNKIRRKGGGRKPYYVTHPNIDSIFEDCIKNNTAGDPMNERIKWTDLTKDEIVNIMNKKEIPVSEFVVRKLLKKYNFVKRKNQKKTY